jgi:hypothetical protein
MYWNSLTAYQQNNTIYNIAGDLKLAALFLQVSETTT